jgi:hypothetical protein
MKLNSDNIKLIFGLKLKQARVSKTWSLAQLAEITGMSVSYLNEIEKGKKYPKSEKILQLSDALDIAYEKLVNLKLDKQLTPVGEILRTNILNELPLGMFGIDKGKLVEIIASAPMKVSAFIGTLMQMADHYNLTQENFYFAALRSYQELHENYFPELEKHAKIVREEIEPNPSKSLGPMQLAQILEYRFGYEVDDYELSQYPDLSNIRSVFIREAHKILVNDQLAENQKSFLFAKEIGYQYLDLSGERALMTPWPRATSFDHVLNNSQASYFAGALLIPFRDLSNELSKFFARKKFSGAALIKLMERYGSSPEMLAVRLTNVIPKHFGLNSLFFLRYDNDERVDEVNQKKELFLSRAQEKNDIGLLNRSCLQWASDEIFCQMQSERVVRKYHGPIANIHRFETPNGSKAFVVMALSRIMKRDQQKSLSVMIGFEENAAFKRKVGWAEDKAIKTTKMKHNQKKMGQEEKFNQIRNAMLDLMEKEKNAADIA